MNMRSTTTGDAAAQIPPATENWYSHTFWLLRWELFTVRRRLMGKVMLALLLAGLLLVMGFITMGYALTSASTATTYTCPPQDSGCVPPSPAEVQQMRAAQQQAVNTVRALVTFPQSIGTAGSYFSIVGAVLLAVLTGALVGGDYRFGIQRLALSRGATRLQLLTAKVAAVAVLALAAVGVCLVVGLLAGVTIGPILGARLSGISAGAWMEILWFWITLAFTAFAFALIALVAATLTRSTAAGVAISLAVILGEGFISTILTGLGLVLQNPTLQHIPDWFLGTNVGALVTLTSQYPLQLTTGSTQLTATHALSVSLTYCIVFIGLSALVLLRRDVTD